jgi:hypothetical protein
LQAYLDQMSTLLIGEALTTVIEEEDEKKQRPCKILPRSRWPMPER